uniref:Uncharacterized protein n=1 Tax=Quercus lobata TaxID=97700 RepID=A0A7N2KW24_QUELO
MKERLERCCKCENGWNYVAGYDYKLKREKDMWKFFELVGLVSGTLGFTCLSEYIWRSSLRLQVPLHFSNSDTLNLWGSTGEKGSLFAYCAIFQNTYRGGARFHWYLCISQIEEL